MFFVILFRPFNYEENYHYKDPSIGHFLREKQEPGFINVIYVIK